MEKGNKILVGLLAFVVVCVMGYALFSENIEVKGTATAKGDFDIGFVCTKTTPTGTATGNCSISGQTIVTKSNLTKPSETVTYLITLTNNGSIPAVLKTIDSPNNYSGEGTSTTNTNAIMYIDFSTLQYAYYNLNDIEHGSNNYDDLIESKEITLQPNESVTLEIVHGWLSNDAGLEQPTVPSTGSSINYNITLGFEQIATN